MANQIWEFLYSYDDDNDNNNNNIIDNIIINNNSNNDNNSNDRKFVHEKLERYRWFSQWRHQIVKSK